MSFGKEVADEYRWLKRVVESRRSTKDTPGSDPPSATPSFNPIDPAVREEIASDLERLIKRHEERREWPAR
jgi:hypothetical protein